MAESPMAPLNISSDPNHYSVLPSFSAGKKPEKFGVEGLLYKYLPITLSVLSRFKV